MPILLGFLACEKVIFEQGANSVSIIGVLHDVYIPVSNPALTPPNAVLPLRWNAFTMWYAGPDDLGKSYEQKAVLLGEEGETLIESEPIQFELSEERPVMRVVSLFSQIPIYRPAKCALKLRFRQRGLDYVGASALSPPPAAPAWRDAMTYPIAIHHTR